MLYDGLTMTADNKCLSSTFTSCWFYFTPSLYSNTALILNSLLEIFFTTIFTSESLLNKSGVDLSIQYCFKKHALPLLLKYCVCVLVPPLSVIVNNTTVWKV